MKDNYPSREERLKEITNRLEAGVTELFEGERFADYLRTMSKFHDYSFGNILLIAIQFPSASQVAGFHDWRKKFGRSVKKGENCPRPSGRVQPTVSPGEKIRARLRLYDKTYLNLRYNNQKGDAGGVSLSVLKGGC